MTRRHLNKIRALTAAAIAIIAIPLSHTVHAQDAASIPPVAEAAAAPVATLEERLADVEAYMNNVARPEKASGADNLEAVNGSSDLSCFSFIDEHQFHSSFASKLNDGRLSCVQNGVEKRISSLLERLNFYPRFLTVSGQSG